MDAEDSKREKEGSSEREREGDRRHEDGLDRRTGVAELGQQLLALMAVALHYTSQQRPVQTACASTPTVRASGPKAALPHSISLSYYSPYSPWLLLLCRPPSGMEGHSMPCSPHYPLSPCRGAAAGKKGGQGGNGAWREGTVTTAPVMQGRPRWCE
jgi:hypothetical protein